MTLHTLATATAWRRQVGDMLTVLFDGGGESTMRELFGQEIRYAPQGEGTLGERMYRAFDAAKKGGAHRIVAIGTDCPSIDADVLNAAFHALETHEVEISPAMDVEDY